ALSPPCFCKMCDDAPGNPKGLRIYGMRFSPFLIILSSHLQYFLLSPIDLKPSWFLECSPGGKVPLLENAEGKFVFESLIICELLEDLFPTPALYPSDPYGKARQRIFITRFSEVCFDVLPLLAELFEDALRDANDAFLGGGTPGMADYMIWPWIERLPSDIALRGGGMCSIACRSSCWLPSLVGLVPLLLFSVYYFPYSASNFQGFFFALIFIFLATVSLINNFSPLYAYFFPYNNDVIGHVVLAPSLKNCKT
uniref:Glutathione S-transferase omega n=1 Tax=Eptatretus burgeri TaxID=7764 RepID=A0A8C4Q343_EPTBU